MKNLSEAVPLSFGCGLPPTAYPLGALLIVSSTEIREISGKMRGTSCDEGRQLLVREHSSLAFPVMPCAQRYHHERDKVCDTDDPDANIRATCEGAQDDSIGR